MYNSQMEDIVRGVVESYGRVVFICINAILLQLFCLNRLTPWSSLTNLIASPLLQLLRLSSSISPTSLCVLRFMRFSQCISLLTLRFVRCTSLPPLRFLYCLAFGSWHNPVRHSFVSSPPIGRYCLHTSRGQEVTPTA